MAHYFGWIEKLNEEPAPADADADANTSVSKSTRVLVQAGGLILAVVLSIPSVVLGFEGSQGAALATAVATLVPLIVMLRAEHHGD